MMSGRCILYSSDSKRRLKGPDISISIPTALALPMLELLPLLLLPASTSSLTPTHPLPSLPRQGASVDGGREQEEEKRLDLEPP